MGILIEQVNLRVWPFGQNERQTWAGNDLGQNRTLWGIDPGNAQNRRII
jgi:hypothetical protein